MSGAGDISGLIEILGRWWTDPELTGLRRLPARATAISFPDDAAARSGVTPWTRDLAGNWSFRLLDQPEAAPPGWADPDRDLDWNTIHVPGCWTMQDVGDAPQYTNVVMPFAGNPPTVPHSNPTGLYRCEFDRPRGWARRRTIAHIAGAESSAAVWCNGSFVGLTTDSRLPTEFDLTSCLRARRNVLALMVIRWSAGTWVEDQDHWFHAGLHRGIHLRSSASTSLADVRVEAELQADLRSGSLEVIARVDGASSGWTIDASLETPGGRRVWSSGSRVHVPSFDNQSHLDAMADADRYPGPVARITTILESVRPWSHEDPHRYRVLVRLRDPAGTVREVVPVLVGFRRVEIRNAELLLNGVAVPIAGVNRHDHHPERGKTLTTEEQREDVAGIKRAGMNAVRTAHYPPDPALLDACDELGLWVVCEANVESHARSAELVHDPRFERAFVERVQRMVATHRNHPAIMGWSLGNEAGDGPAHHAAAAWVRAADPRRFVQYEGGVRPGWLEDPASVTASPTSDIVCPMYPSVDDLQRWATKSAPDAPLIMCEYSHAMGNSNGGLAEYWRLIEQHRGLQGGFIWDWRDQGLTVHDADGREYWAVGGAFGDEPNDAAFCCNGLVGPDGEPHPAVEEHRWLIRPVRVERTGRALRIHNRRSYSDLGDLRARAVVEVDGVEVSSTELAVPTIGAGEIGDVDFELPDLPSGVEGHLTVIWSLRRSRSWAPAGHVVSWDQFTLEVDPAPAPTAQVAQVTALPDGAECGPMTVRFDTRSGLLVELSVDGRQLLTDGARLALWRAPTDNDGVAIGPRAGVAGARPSWLALGLDNLIHEPAGVEVRAHGGTVRARSEHHWRGRGGFVAHHWQRVVIEPSGTIRFDEDVQIPQDVIDLPRVGVRFSLAPGLEYLSWYGPGPWETYPDRHHAPVGRWEQTVEDQFVPYVTPQHHGSHVAARWAELLDDHGRGVRLVLDGLTFDVSHYPAAHLTEATTLAQLRPTPDVHVHVDGALRGLGTASCGPDTTELVRGGRHRFRWSISAVG